MALLFDEYGNPLPPNWQPKSQAEALIDRSMTPPVGSAQQEEPPEQYGPPTPTVYGGARAQSRNPILAEAGISTEGRVNEIGKQQREDYLSQERRFAGATGQQMPQQFGTEEPPRNDEGPLSPRETAAAMPATQQGMNKLLMQHLLPMHPALKKLTPDGYQNHRTMQKEKEAAEKEQRQQQAQINRAAGAEKSQNAWDQTLRLNALQGAGPMAGGGGYGGNGPKVQRIGGYAFVSGTWRPADSMEQAKLNQMNATTDYTRARPGMEQQENESRERIAGAALQARSAENEANRGIQRDRLAEDARYHDLLAGDRADARQVKIDEASAKKVAQNRSVMEQVFGDLLELEEFASTDDRSWINPTWILPEAVDPWAPPSRGSPDWMKKADQQRIRDPKTGSPTGKRESVAGSYKALQRRLMNAAIEIANNTPEGEDPNIPDEIKKYLEPMFQEQLMKGVEGQRYSGRRQF